MISRKDALLLTLASVAFASAGTPCWPQTIGAPAQGNGGTASTAPAAPVQRRGTIEEVIVTAEKRSSKVQQTPIAITAVTGKQLQQRHVEEFQDLQAVAPSVQMVPVGQTIQVNVRGVGSNFFDPRGETSVSSSIDGFYYARPAPNGDTFFDVNRVEILNGPQGTLYGTNAAAGAVNLITNQPVDRIEGYIEGSVGNYDMREYAGMLNIPVSDTFAIRISGKGILHDGYISDYYDDAADNAARAIVQWKPNDQFSATFEYNYSQFDGHGAVPVSYPCDPTPFTNVVSQRCAPPGARGGDFPLDGKVGNILATYQLNLNYDLGFATITSITGRVAQSDTQMNIPNGTDFNADIAQSSHDLSEEVRIAGHGDANHAGGFNWVVGGYYSTGNGKNLNIPIDFGPPQSQPRLPEETEAGFGQATYGITDTIRATAGIRYTHDTKGVDDTDGSDITVPYSHINYRLGLEDSLSKASLLYATVATGYVAGGADGGSVTVPTPSGFVPPIFKPENILSYELGSKNTFLDRRLVLNGDFYYYIIKNFQSYNPGLLNNDVIGLQIQDVANVDTFGGEMSLAYALTPDDRLTLAGSLAHGEFGSLKIDSFAQTPTAIAPVLIKVPSGYPLTNLPSWDVRVGYSHDFYLPNEATLNAGVNSHISGGYWVVPASSDPYDRQKSYSMTDLHLTYTGTRGISVEAYIKNVENAAVTNYAENPGFHLYYFLPPRTYGVTVRYAF